MMTSRYDYMTESNVEDIDGEKYPDIFSVNYSDFKLTKIPKPHRISSAHPTVIVTDNHHLLNIKSIDRNEETTNRRTHWTGDHPTGIFDDFRITIFNAERGG